MRSHAKKGCKTVDLELCNEKTKKIEKCERAANTDHGLKDRAQKKKKKKENQSKSRAGIVETHEDQMTVEQIRSSNWLYDCCCYDMRVLTRSKSSN